MFDLASMRLILTTVIADASTVAVLGCGSPLRGDDAAGSLVAIRLGDLTGQARAFYGDVAPENLTGEIKRFHPELLLVIDIVDAGLAVGELAVIPLEKISGVSFSTHKLPLPIMLDYLEQEIACRIVVLGIQATNLEFMSEMTPEVSQTVDALAAELRLLLES